MGMFLCDLMAPGGPHFFWWGLATLWVFSAAVSALNAPDSNSSPGYQWLYRFTHLLAANLDRAGLLNLASAGPSDQPASK